MHDITFALLPILRALLALALCAPGGLAYRSFTANIPNGDHVPHPCKPNFIWHGVGHRNAEGGGDRNPFGEDFDKNGQEVIKSEMLESLF